MIRDLKGAGKLECSAEFLIIGGGTVGLILATRLAALGRRVVCLESGSTEQEDETHPLNAAEHSGARYGGAEHGRFRCLGGSSTRWGGALIPFQAPDLLDGGWPVAIEELSVYIAEIETLFGLESGPYEDLSVLRDADYLARLAKWPPFRNRNVYTLLRKEVQSEIGPQVWINATVVLFTVNDGLVASVQAKCADGSSIVVTAQETVIAAGAIESTRLLLLLDRNSPGQVSGKGLGEGFHDHLSAKIADLEVLDKNKLNRTVGFRFSAGGGMRNLRFELAPSSALRQCIPPCFAHVSFTDREGGFEALRDFFRAVQRRRVPELRVFGRLILGIPWLARTAWWRYVEHRLLIPDAARLEVHMVLEQAALPSNKVELSESEFDCFGLPLPRITWTVDSVDMQAMERAVSSFDKCWNSGPLAKLAEFRRRPQEEISRDMAGCGGIYHPAGTTRMAAGAANGVVDNELRVFGLTNLSVCSTSVLPTGGGANPTMMLLLLGLRLVKRLSSAVEYRAEGAGASQ